MSVNLMTETGLVELAGLPEVLTYSISKNSNNEIILTDSNGNTSKVTDANTKYTFNVSGDKLVITDTDGGSKEITIGGTMTKEQIISVLGYTPGNYSKPSDGIPKTDLASSVQTSLGKADTALQSHQDISGKQDKLTDAQMSAVNSGITSTKVSTYDGYSSTIAGKQDAITSTNKLSYDLISGTPTIPTKVSDLTNDSNFITKAVDDLTNYYKKTETYTQEEINGLISAIPKFDIKVVATLPTTEISTTTIYLLTSGTESQNLYTEYIYVNGAWEKLGTQTVDLSDYALKSELPTAEEKAIWNGKQDALTTDQLTATNSGITSAKVSTYDGYSSAISGKQDKITSTNKLSYDLISGTPDVVTDATVGGWGYTKNTGDYTKPTTGIPKSDLATDVQTSLGKADTAIQDISGKQDKITESNKLPYSLISGTPSIPSEVTESTVSGWGFTKNTGNYSKPSTGIPKSDLANDIQTSLGKADTALQTHQDISGKQDKITESNKLPYSLVSGTPTSLPANGGTATKANQDGDGNVITTTYATKEELKIECPPASEKLSGQSVICTDSADNGKLKDLKVYGACEQGENPTPENPQVVKAVVNPKVASYQTAIIKEYIFYPLYVPKGKPVVMSRTVATSNAVAFNFYDENKQLVDYWSIADKSKSREVVVSTTTDTYYVRIKTTSLLGADTYTIYSKDDSKSVTMNGITLYGIGDVKDVVDVERGKIVRYFASVDLGNLTWSYNAQENHERFSSSQISNIAQPANDKVSNILCPIYTVATANNVYSHTMDKIISIANPGFVSLCDLSYTNATTLKNDLVGKTLLYELATPTEEDIPSTILAQLKALESYNPTTNVSVSSDQIDGTLSFEYVKEWFSTNVKAVEGKIEEATHATTADSATKATQDANGNVINTTYALKSEIPTSLPANGGTANYAKEIVDSSGNLEEVGSETQPIYLNGGVFSPTTYTLGASVPANAKFTDTTYSAATTSAAGLMSADDKTKLNGIAAGATNVTSATVSGWGFKTTDNNTTYTFATGDANGQIKVTPSGGTAQNVSVKGLGSLAYSSATIPTNTNQLTNGAGFITSSDIPASLPANGGTATNITQRVSGSAATDAGYPNNQNYVPDMSFMAYWNGAFSGSSSNLKYCAYGDIIGSSTIGYQSVNYATTAGSLKSSDEREQSLTPNLYCQKGMGTYSEFKDARYVGLTSGYYNVTTIVPWVDTSGGYPIQFANGSGKYLRRYGTSDTDWSDWEEVIVNSDLSSYIPKSAFSLDGTTLTITI